MALLDSSGPKEVAAQEGLGKSRMRIEMPEPRPSSVVSIDHGPSDSDEVQPPSSVIEDDDIQSIVGVSISRAQTALRSPRTPAVERAAVIEKYGRDGFFDWALATDKAQESGRRSLPNDDSQTGVQTPIPRHTSGSISVDDVTLPSPWVAEPKLFPRSRGEASTQTSQTARQRAATGPMGILSDLNLKRFLSTFSLPTLPKPPPLPELSVPTLSTLVGTTNTSKSSEPSSKRAKSGVDVSARYHRTPEDSNRSTRAERAGNSDPIRLKSPIASRSSSNHVASRGADGNFVETDHDQSHSYGSGLKRSTSDQSLTLRRESSLASSLGDDARWVNVQKMVNSRTKAIADSLQDSSIRFPSLPSLPNVSMTSLRPEFLRNRAASDVIRNSSHRKGDRELIYGASQASLERPDGGIPPNLETQSAKKGDPTTGRKPSQSAWSYLDKALDSLNGDVVVLGGYRGSVLRSAKPPHRQLWVPVKVGLNIRKVDLEVGLEAEDETRMEETIIPSGMLSHIGPIDMGRRLLKRLRACRNAREGRLRVHDYGYDWRLSPHLISERFIKHLDSLRAASKARGEQAFGAVVIAHSLGGLITRHALNQRPELFSGVLYAGVPQHCINILGPLRNGDEVLLSSKVLTAQVNFTLRTSFLLLPEDGICFMDKQTKKEYPVDFFDLAEWKRHALSPCIAPASPPFMALERKNLFSTVTGTLTTLPLIGRKDSNQSQNAKSRAQPDHPKIATIADPDPHLDKASPAPVSPTVARSTIPLDKAEEYLKRTLSDTVRFKNELQFNSEHAKENRYPPLSILYGTSVPTVSRARVAGKDGIKCQDAYDDLAFASGDGVCLAKAAMLPPGYRYVAGGKVRTERGHVGLLGDLEAVEDPAEIRPGINVNE
ncbi:MAG: hypothetical protein Q9183_001103 [Haloplaca sp. 2 TL-2023]